VLKTVTVVCAVLFYLTANASAVLSDTTDDGTGTISARGQNLPSEGAAKVFDNNSATKWLDFSPASSWIQYQYAFDKRSVVMEYTLTSANDFNQRDPMNWNILGSNNNGASWVSGDGETNWTSEWYNYTWTNIVNATASMPLMGTIGNHEGSGNCPIFEKYRPFPFVAAPADYFSFDYGPVHVAVVDQYTAYTNPSTQYTWLVSDLSASTKPWKIIVLHQPGWSCGGGHSNDTTVQGTIQPLCLTYGVQIVLGGHNHYYSRAVVSGVQHLTHGGGGAPLYTPSAGQPNIVTYTQSLAVSKVEISGSTLTCTTINSSGSVIDTFTLTNP